MRYYYGPEINPVLEGTNLEELIIILHSTENPEVMNELACQHFAILVDLYEVDESALLSKGDFGDFCESPRDTKRRPRRNAKSYQRERYTDTHSRHRERPRSARADGDDRLWVRRREALQSAKYRNRFILF